MENPFGIKHPVCSKADASPLRPKPAPPIETQPGCVYLVLDGDYAIQGVFSTAEKANDYAAERNARIPQLPVFVVEWELDRTRL